ncbi:MULTISPECIES: hypothetical protein [Streptomyces]|uniref:hypothetical protein n=1 Tax=Streptomyces TaxID=1883 RepID=UPI002E2DB358|nr:hypothetical protein [[Kitasatospora] papulosa]
MTELPRTALPPLDSPPGDRLDVVSAWDADTPYQAWRPQILVPPRFRPAASARVYVAVNVSGDDQAEARAAPEGLAVKLLQAGERRGRGQAVGGDIDGLRAIARACPDTLTGDRDKALTLTGFHYASHAARTRPGC